MLDQRVAVHGSAGGAGVHVHGAQSRVPVQHRPRALGQATGRPVALVQQHAVPDAVAGVQGHAVAVAVARTPLSAHALPTAQTASLGTVLRSRVGHHVVVPSNLSKSTVDVTIERACGVGGGGFEKSFGVLHVWRTPLADGQDGWNGPNFLHAETPTLELLEVTGTKGSTTRAYGVYRVFENFYLNKRQKKKTTIFILTFDNESSKTCAAVIILCLYAVIFLVYGNINNFISFQSLRNQVFNNIMYYNVILNNTDLNIYLFF